MLETVYKLNVGRTLCIALLADIHARDGREFLQVLKRKKPDIIAIPGDFVHGKSPQESGIMTRESLVRFQKNVIPLLEECTRIAPTYASLGNHEAFLDAEDCRLIEDTGVVLLDNAFRKTENFVIGGLTAGHVINYRQYRGVYQKHGGTERYPIRAKKEKPKWFDVEDKWLDEFEKQEDLKILLSHHPEYWSLRRPYLSHKQINLVLSGHAHGGQIRFFNQGLYAPGQGWFPRYTRGIFSSDNGYMIVSAGLSNTAAPIPRLNNPQEVVFIELR